MTRADRKSRAEYFRTMFSVGAYSPNDIRNAEDMNPIKGGDQYFVQTSMAPLESFMEPPAPDPATVEPPQEVNGNGRFADIRRN